MLSKATNLLREWRAKTGLTTREAAAIVGISHTSYFNYERGETEPRATAISLIHRATGGSVTAASWCEPADGKAA